MPTPESRAASPGAVTLRFAPARVEVERRADGATVLRSPAPLRPPARAVGEWLVEWARRAPDRVFLAERAGDGWRTVTYGEALRAARRIGQALLDRGLSAGTPVAILSDNSVDHALLALGALHVGVPVAPISPAYSLMSKDFAKLRYIHELVAPGLVWTADPEKFAPALAAIGATATPLADLYARSPGRPSIAPSRASARRPWRRSSSPPAPPGPRRA